MPRNIQRKINNFKIKAREEDIDKVLSIFEELGPHLSGNELENIAQILKGTNSVFFYSVYDKALKMKMGRQKIRTLRYFFFKFLRVEKNHDFISILYEKEAG